VDQLRVIWFTTLAELLFALIPIEKDTAGAEGRNPGCKPY
jgi:hypothetical protein